jgi:hypothetical protein
MSVGSSGPKLPYARKQVIEQHVVFVHVVDINLLKQRLMALSKGNWYFLSPFESKESSLYSCLGVARKSHGEVLPKYRAKKNHDL